MDDVAWWVLEHLRLFSVTLIRQRLPIVADVRVSLHEDEFSTCIVPCSPVSALGIALCEPDEKVVKTEKSSK
jgi:hypothetical protein